MHGKARHRSRDGKKGPHWQRQLHQGDLVPRETDRPQDDQVDRDRNRNRHVQVAAVLRRVTVPLLRALVPDVPPDQAWELLRPDREPPRERNAPGIGTEELGRVASVLERIQ